MYWALQTVLFLGATTSVRAASYNIDLALGACNTHGCNEYIGYTEGQMYAKGNGPPTFVLSDTYTAYIGLEADFVTPANWPESVTYQLSGYSCSRKYYDDNVAYFTGSSHISANFTVADTAKQLVILQVCSDDLTDVDDITAAGAELSFYNSYGFIPGKLIGWLPVYFALMLAAAALFLVYGGVALVHLSELLLLQGLIAGVQLLTILEAATWFGYLLHMNDTGEPICCPIASTAMFAIACTVVKRLVSRMLMLLVCIGYGVIRQRITRKELSCLLALSTTYFLFAYLVETAEGNSLGEDSAILYKLCLLVCDFAFAYWVITGLGNTMKELAQNKASLKYKMYRNLFITLVFFLGLWIFYFVIITILEWTIEMNTLETVVLSPKISLALVNSLWPIIYFAFLVTISVIWRPSTQSHMLAMSFELSSDEISPDVELDNMNERADDFSEPVPPSDAVNVDVVEGNPTTPAAVVEQALAEVKRDKHADM